MSVEPSNQSGGSFGGREALAEIRAYGADLQTFLDGLFDRLEGLADGLLVQEARQARGEPGRSALDEQIERLAALTDELAESIAQHKRLRAKENGD